MRRLITIAAVGAIFLLTGVTAMAGPGFTGTAAGRDVDSTNASVCNTVPGGGGGSCVYKVHGTYYDDNKILVDGTYTGTETINWALAAVNPNYNNENCAPVSGTITFKRTGKSGTLVTQLASSGPGSFSFACETPPVPAFVGWRDIHLMLQVTSVTGYFKNLVKNPAGSFINWDGTSVPSSTGRIDYVGQGPALS